MTISYTTSATVFEKTVLLLAFLMLLGCQEETVVVKFPESQILRGRHLQEIALLTGKGNISFAVADTFLVVQKAEEPFIQIYSTNTHKLLAEFGNEGRGPGEYLEPGILKQAGYEKSNNSPVIYLYDFKRQMISTLNILEVLENGNISKQEKIFNDHILTFFHYRDENFYLGTPYRGGRFSIHDYRTSRNTIIPYVPKPVFTIPEDRFSEVYRSAAVVNTNKGLIAAAPILLGRLDFFDLDGNYLRSTIFESANKYSEKYSAALDIFNTLKFQIADLVSKNDLIYGLNINSEISHFAGMQGEYNMKVQVFDWDGKPVKEYILDDRLITSFAIDEDNNRIYAYSPLEPEHPIIIYNIE